MEVSDYLEMVTIYKDISLGKYSRDIIPEWIYTLDKRSEIKLPKEEVDKIFDIIDKHLNEYDLSEKTNVEIHFTVKPESMVQYISPYTKEYKVGKTQKYIHEYILYSFRPEYVHPGYIKEITVNKNTINEINSHEFGHIDDYLNIVLLHTHEKNIKPISSEFSTLHFAILKPVGNELFRKMCLLYKEQTMRKK